MEPISVYYFDGSFDRSKSPSVCKDSAVHDVSQPSFADSIPHRQFELVELSSGLGEPLSTEGAFPKLNTSLCTIRLWAPPSNIHAAVCKAFMVQTADTACRLRPSRMCLLFANNVIYIALWRYITEVIRNEPPVTTIKDPRVAALLTLLALIKQLQKEHPFIPTYMFYNHTRPSDYPLWSKELVHVASQFLGKMTIVNVLQLGSHSYRQTHIWQNTFPNG